VLLNLEIDFRHGLPPGEITESINRLEREIRRRHPEVQRIFIEARALGGRGEARASMPGLQRDEKPAEAGSQSLV
jgi:divalent metal cation (Fe/Co/Zn/Cd) transporter